MKNWNIFRNWLIALLICEVTLLLLCFFYAPQILLEQLLFFFLALFAAVVLSDLLLVWTLILSFGLGIIFLITGIVYMTTPQILILLISFPLLTGFLTKVRYYLFKTALKVQDKTEDAQVDYRAMLDNQTDGVIQSLLIHWSHEDMFFELKPKEYSRVLTQIQEVIRQELSEHEQLYYLSNGDFLVLTEDNKLSLQELYENNLKGNLERLVFHGDDGNQGIQYQTGYQTIDWENSSKYPKFTDLASNLKRQLETDVIVEY